jgi:hypothetical protein
MATTTFLPTRIQGHSDHDDVNKILDGDRFSDLDLSLGRLVSPVKSVGTSWKE